VCLAASLLALAPAPVATARVDAGLSADVAAGRRPVAVVLLHVPALEASTPALAGRSKAGRAAILDAQRAVLTALEGTGWEPRHRYMTLPAITGVATPAALAVLASLDAVRRVGPDARLRATGAGASAYVGAERVHERTGLRGAGVTVAVLDSGLTLDHPDFAGRVLVGGAFLDQGRTSDDVTDESGHGTNVAGLLASAGAVASPGVAPGARLLVYKVLDAENAGWVSDWAAAADHAAANLARWPDLRVTNNSLESTETFAACPCRDEQAWVELAAAAWGGLTAAGVLNVACTGNQGLSAAVSVPACLADVVGVGAVYDHDGGREPDSGAYHDPWPGFADCADEATGPDVPACFTNVSACLDLLAPGVELLSSDRAGAAATWYTGTSQASPLVAGAAALLAEAVPDAGPDRLAAALAASSVLVPVPRHPRGSVPRLDVVAALADLGVSTPDGAPESAGGAEPPDDDRPASSGCSPGPLPPSTLPVPLAVLLFTLATRRRRIRRPT
jgi:subtilisin family serine protease